jgi:predicted NBD/HSP70 family sugar kinase
MGKQSINQRIAPEVTPVRVSSVTSNVLAAIRGRGAPVSKAEIIRLTDLSLATVTEHVEILCASGLLREEDFGASSGGRKPKLYGFNPEAGHILAVDLESTHVRVVITDFGLRILHDVSSDDIDVTRGPEDTLGRIRALAFDLMTAGNVDPSSIKGLGMGLPGPVSFTEALPSSLSLMPGWENFPVRAYWKAYLECPTYVDNNVYTMALGERAIDPANAPANMIFVKIGNGIGAGIITGGQVYRGATEHAGEIGHINIGHDRLCYCGNRGCLEAVAGGRAIAAAAEAQARDGRSERLAGLLAAKKKLSLPDVISAAEDSDSIAVALIRESGGAVGGVLAGLVNFFNPSHIVVGGSVSLAGDVLLASVRQAIYQYSLPLSTRTLTIRHSFAGARAGVVGAAILALDQAIARHSLQPVDDTASGGSRRVLSHAGQNG